MNIILRATYIPSCTKRSVFLRLVDHSGPCRCVCANSREAAPEILRACRRIKGPTGNKHRRLSGDLQERPHPTDLVEVCDSFVARGNAILRARAAIYPKGVGM